MRKSIRDLILAEANAAKAVVEKATTEERDLTETELNEIDTRMKKAAEMKANSEREEAFKAQMTDLSQGLGLGEKGADVDRREAKTDERRMTVGERFSTSPEYKNLLSSVPAGVFSEKARVNSNP